MFTLYSRISSGSAAVEALFAELGVEFELREMPRNSDGSTPETLLNVNPLGKIPVLRLPDNSLMTESAAMLISWAPDVTELFKRHMNLADFYQRVAKRPKIAAVWTRNGMPLS